MASEYTHRATICAPVDMLHEANQLACIVGEHEDDLRTFTVATHTRHGVEYACISTVVKAVFEDYPTQGLPDPPHAAEADRVAAYVAFASLNQPRGIVYDLTEAGGESPQDILTRLGMVPIPTDEDDEGEE